MNAPNYENAMLELQIH